MATLQLPDGRKLAYERSGDPAGVSVIFHHGAGDSRLARHPDESLTCAAGVQLITVDRPGYGGSSPKPGRTLRDWALDVEHLADALQLKRFVSAGWSGGGPHALAVAHDLGERVTAVVLASPLGPMHAEGAPALVRRDLRFLWRIRRLPALLGLAVAVEAGRARRRPAAFVRQWFDRAPLLDQEMLRDSQIRTMLVAQSQEGFRQQGAGLLADLLALADWHFEPEDVKQPIQLWHGTEDEVLLPGMGRALAGRLPNCTAYYLDGEGHFCLFRHWHTILSRAAGTDRGQPLRMPPTSPA